MLVVHTLGGRFWLVFCEPVLSEIDAFFGRDHFRDHFVANMPVANMPCRERACRYYALSSLFRREQCLVQVRSN